MLPAVPLCLPGGRGPRLLPPLLTSHVSGPGTVDVPRQPTWEEPARRLARQAARAALAVTWRSLAPEGREPFAVPPAGYPWRLDRVYYEADDGWRAPLFRLDPRPGGAGEPVVLAHGLGWNHHILDYRADLSLARTLSVQGFTVYLLEHRGDRSALPPAEGERSTSTTSPPGICPRPWSRSATRRASPAATGSVTASADSSSMPGSPTPGGRTSRAR